MRSAAASLLPRAAACPAAASSASSFRRAVALCRNRRSPVSRREEGNERRRRRLGAFNAADDAGGDVIDIESSSSSASPSRPSSSASPVGSMVSMTTLLFEARVLLLELSRLFESERQASRGGDEPSRRELAVLSMLPRALPLIQRWIAFATRLAALDRMQREREEREAGEASPSSSPSPLFPSELIWRDLRDTFPDSLDDFESMAAFHEAVLAWLRATEDEASRALHGSRAGRRRSRPLEEVAALVGGGEKGGRALVAAAAAAAASSSSSPAASTPPPRSSSSSGPSSSNLTLSMVSAARAAADAGVRGKVKAALRVRAQIDQHHGGSGSGSGGEGEGASGAEAGGASEEGEREPLTPTLACPSRPERAPRLARAAWKDPRAMLVLYALTAIAALPERSLDEALAALLLKKLSDLPSPPAAAAAPVSRL